MFATLAARDADSGVLGTEGVRFTDISGPLREHLLLDPLTGRLALAHTGFRSIMRGEAWQNGVSVAVGGGG